MGRKEITTKEDLMKVIELFENTGITYWLDGGWGVDILAGKQTRIHRDIDINFDAQHTEKLLNVLLNLGYKIDTDWKPVRIELYSDELGYLDIHPFVLNEDGTSKQADLEGGWYEFEKDYFGSAFFEGKTIPCISLKGQRVFHSGVADGLFCREIDGLFCRSSPDIIVRRRCVLSHKRRGWLQPSPSFRYSRNLALQDELYHPVINNGPAVLVCVDKRLGTGPVNQSRDAG